MVSIDTLREQFNGLGMDTTSEILETCEEICQRNSIEDAEEFVETWMAYSLSHLGGTEPTIAFLLEFERKDLSPKTQSNSRVLTKAQSDVRIYGVNESSSVMEKNIEDAILLPYGCQTPKSQKNRVPFANTPKSLFSPASYSPVSGLQQMVPSKLVGKALCTFGSSTVMNSTSWKGDTKTAINYRVKQLSSENVVDNECYMFDTLSNKCSIFGDKIFSIGKEILDKVLESKESTGADNEPVEPIELSSVDRKSQYEIHCVGVISSAINSRLDSQTTMLIGADETTLHTVNLDLSKLQPYAVFPGQIVYIKGMNPSGDTLFVEDIQIDRIVNAPIPPIGLTESLSIVAASGPFTLNGDLTYEPLHALLDYCKENIPNVIILNGPFLEETNTLITDGILAEDFSAYFEKMIAGIMTSIDESMQVFIVSSSKDVHGSMVYPTHPYNIEKSYSNLKFLPDPCIIEVNGVEIGITSTDVIGDIYSEELSSKSHPQDRIKRAVNYLFNQKSFYPIHPPCIEVPIDHEMAAKYAVIEKPPNILLVSSSSTSFIRDISGCLAVNPGRMAGLSNSTFVRLKIYPPKDETALIRYVAGQVIRAI